MDAYLSDADVRVLNLARTILHEVVNRAVVAEADTPDYLRDLRAMYRGELRHAAHMAELMVFEVLNQANSARLAELTDEQLYNRPVETVAS